MINKATHLKVARGLVFLTLPHGDDAFCANEVISVKTSGNSSKVRDVQITCKYITDVKHTLYEVEAVPAETVTQLLTLLEETHHV